MNEALPSKHITLLLDELVQEDLCSYMLFINETGQCPEAGLSAHAVSLIAFGLEEHEDFQRWLTAKRKAKNPGTSVSI